MVHGSHLSHLCSDEFRRCRSAEFSADAKTTGNVLLTTRTFSVRLATADEFLTTLFG